MLQWGRTVRNWHANAHREILCTRPDLEFTVRICNFDEHVHQRHYSEAKLGQLTHSCRQRVADPYDFGKQAKSKL